MAHPYEQPGTGSVSLTTTWQATYTLAGDATVRPVPGLATTVNTSPEFEVREASARLVRGTCEQYPEGPGC